MPELRLVEIGKRMVHPGSFVKVFSNRFDLIKLCLRGATISNKKLQITDRLEFKSCLPMLAANVVDFGEKSAPESVRALSAWIINEAAQHLGAKLNSAQELYVAIAEGKSLNDPKKLVQKMSFPAVNIRGNSLDTARALFRAAVDNKVGALIIEIARSEMGYTNQAPREFAAVVLAAAMLEGYMGPIFLQGDHIQLKAAALKEGGEKAEKEIKAHTALIRDLIENGFGNIDLDMSPLEMRDRTDLSFDAQQAENAKWTARKIKEVRDFGVELGIPWLHLLGGETGEVGKMNTRPEDIDAYARGITANMNELGIDPALGIRKIAVNDGTAHGGVILPDGKRAEVSIAFDVLKMGTEVGKKYGWAGTVQHGASTLPENAFSLFPENNAVEVHLATAYQNVLLKHVFEGDKKFQSTFEQFITDTQRKEWKAGKTFAQFFGSSSKNGIGPFKYQFWTMPEEIRAAVAGELYETFSRMFNQLNVTGTEHQVRLTVTDHEFHRPYPESAEDIAQAGVGDVKGLDD
jgi:fructose/tagatose bisphosphate aldolase